MTIPPENYLSDCLIKIAKEQLLDLRMGLRTLESSLTYGNEHAQIGAIIAVRLLHKYMITGVSFDAVKAIQEFESS
jgi:hypothetical protein